MVNLLSSRLPACFTQLPFHFARDSSQEFVLQQLHDRSGACRNKQPDPLSNRWRAGRKDYPHRGGGEAAGAAGGRAVTPHVRGDHSFTNEPRQTTGPVERTSFEGLCWRSPCSGSCPARIASYAQFRNRGIGMQTPLAGTSDC